MGVDHSRRQKGQRGGGCVGVASTILTVIGYLLLGVLGLLLVLVAVLLWSPVEFQGAGSVYVEATDEPGELAPDAAEDRPIDFAASARGQLRLLWGAVAITHDGLRVLWWRRSFGSRVTAGADGRAARVRAKIGRKGSAGGDDASQQSQPVTEKRATPWSTSSDRRITLADVRRLLPDVRRSAARSWRALSLRLRAHFIVGLDDPATTGLLAGAAPAIHNLLTAGVNARRPGSLVCRLSPVFDREVLAADVELSGRTTLGSLSWPWIRLALRRDVRPLWWPKRRRKT